MAPLPQLDLTLSSSKNKISSSENDGSQIIVRTDSALLTHTITIYITDEESGKAVINLPNCTGKNVNSLQIPTYKMMVTDSLTEEKKVYEITRDFVIPAIVEKKEKQSSFWSFLSFDFLKPKTSLYDVMTFEPEVQEEVTYKLLKHRSLNHDLLHYSFKNEEKTISLFAGDFDSFEKPENLDTLFLVIDGQKGQRFIGDILYREKFLKLTPKVELKIIRRKKIPKSIEFNKNGIINKIIYI